MDLAIALFIGAVVGGLFAQWLTWRQVHKQLDEFGTWLTDRYGRGG